MRRTLIGYDDYDLMHLFSNALLKFGFLRYSAFNFGHKDKEDKINGAKSESQFEGIHFYRKEH
jgi:hypothetical protein